MENKRASNTPKNYFESAPAKELTSKGGVRKRKSYGFGSKLEANKAGLIEAEEKLELISGQYKSLEEQFIKVTNDLNATNLIVQTLKAKLANIEEEFDNHAEDLVKEKHQSLLIQLSEMVSERRRFDEQRKLHELDVEEFNRDRKELLKLREINLRYNDSIEYLNVQLNNLKNLIPESELIKQEMLHAIKLLAEEKDRDIMQDITKKFNTFRSHPIPNEPGAFVQYMLNFDTKQPYEVACLFEGIIAKARKPANVDKQEKDYERVSLLCEVLHRLINQRFVGIPCGSYTDIRKDVEKITTEHLKPFRCAGAIFPTEDNTQKQTKPYRNSWVNNTSTKVVNQRFITWAPYNKIQQEISNPYKAVFNSSSPDIVLLQESDSLIKSKNSIIADILLPKEGSKFDFVDKAVIRLFESDVSKLDLTGAALRDKIVELVLLDGDIQSRAQSKNNTKDADKRFVRREQSGFSKYTALRERFYSKEERLPKACTKILPVLDVNPGSKDGVIAMLDNIILTHGVDIDDRERHWFPTTTDGNPMVQIIKLKDAENVIPVAEQKYSKILPISGGFHFETNFTARVFDHFHDFIFQDFCFYSNYLHTLNAETQKKCQSHRRTWHSIYHVFMPAMLGYIVSLYNEERSAPNFFDWNFFDWASARAVGDHSFSVIFDLTFKLLVYGYLYRMYSRSNTATERYQCMGMMASIFHVTNSPNYQLIDIYTFVQRSKLRVDVVDFLDSVDTVSPTGHPMLHQWRDELIEQANKQVKRANQQVKRQAVDGQTIDDWNEASALADFREQSNAKSEGQVRNNPFPYVDIIAYRFIKTNSRLFLRKVGLKIEGVNPDFVDFMTIGQNRREESCNTYLANGSLTNAGLIPVTLSDIEEQKKKKSTQINVMKRYITHHLNLSDNELEKFHQKMNEFTVPNDASTKKKNENREQKRAFLTTYTLTKEYEAYINALD